MVSDCSGIMGKVDEVPEAGDINLAEAGEHMSLTFWHLSSVMARQRL